MQMEPWFMLALNQLIRYYKDHTNLRKQWRRVHWGNTSWTQKRPQSSSWRSWTGGAPARGSPADLQTWEPCTPPCAGLAASTSPPPAPGPRRHKLNPCTLFNNLYTVQFNPGTHFRKETKNIAKHNQIINSKANIIRNTKISTFMSASIPCMALAGRSAQRPMYTSLNLTGFENDTTLGRQEIKCIKKNANEIMGWEVKDIRNRNDMVLKKEEFRYVTDGNEQRKNLMPTSLDSEWIMYWKWHWKTNDLLVLNFLYFLYC